MEAAVLILYFEHWKHLAIQRSFFKELSWEVFIKNVQGF